MSRWVLLTLALWGCASARGPEVVREGVSREALFAAMGRPADQIHGPQYVVYRWLIEDDPGNDLEYWAVVAEDRVVAAGYGRVTGNTAGDLAIDLRRSRSPPSGRAGPPERTAALDAQIATSEYVTRRARAMEVMPDGLLLVHARTSEKAMEQWGFVQDGTFQYFTGLADLPGAILALDGPRGEARLFLPPPSTSFGMEVRAGIAAGPVEARARGLTAVQRWDGFTAWVAGRVAEGVPLYLDGPRRPEATGAPPGMRPVAGDRALWHAAVVEAFPGAEIRSAREAIQRLRWSKSAAEVALLERNAQATVAALGAAAAALAPGRRQRDSEAAVVAACIEAGAEGPSFWPWTMAGPNAHTERLVGAFFDYGHLDRTMQVGEVVRVDIGCGGGGYGADVGRTLPVSGTFGPGQREVWDLLVAAYRAGLARLRAGVSLDDVRAASVAEVGRRAPAMRTDVGREAAALLLARGTPLWHVHGVGIESGEEAVDPFVAGAVIAYEPTLEVGPDAFYLEDMVLVTEDGHRVLSSGLPYTATEVEAFMARARRR